MFQRAWIMLLILLCFFSFAAAQSDILKWCTISEPEQSKCNSMSEALSRYFFESRIQKDRFKINCVQAFSKAECMQYLDSNVVDVTSMDPGDIYIGGRYHSLLPIAQEMSNGNYINSSLCKQFY
ncbi:melanotransferrin-like [Artemia franciscana]|uniref:melanotransferrin-like n=1 Tax=Artemia franciscana TaxID=6661 RepID=UPI0032D9D377